MGRFGSLESKIFLSHMDNCSWRDNPEPGPLVWSCWIKYQVLLSGEKERRLGMKKRFYAGEQWSSRWTKLGISQPNLSHQMKILAGIQQWGQHIPNYRE